MAKSAVFCKIEHHMVPFGALTSGSGGVDGPALVNLESEAGRVVKGGGEPPIQEKPHTSKTSAGAGAANASAEGVRHWPIRLSRPDSRPLPNLA